MKTKSIHIAGMWFHVQWYTNDIGKDQYGNLWRNYKEPYSENEQVVNTALDAYNDIISKVNQFHNNKKH